MLICTQFFINVSIQIDEFLHGRLRSRSVALGRLCWRVRVVSAGGYVKPLLQSIIFHARPFLIETLICLSLFMRWRRSIRWYVLSNTSLFRGDDEEPVTVKVIFTRKVTAFSRGRMSRPKIEWFAWEWLRSINTTGRELLKAGDFSSSSFFLFSSSIPSINLQYLIYRAMLSLSLYIYILDANLALLL